MIGIAEPICWRHGQTVTDRVRGCALGLGLNDSLSVEEGFWTSASSLGAVTSSSGLAGTARMVTLTLQVAGVPGTYHLWLSNGSCYSTA